MAVSQLVPFPDNKEGNDKAEELFKKIVKENDCLVTDEDLECCLEDGYYENGVYYLAIVHSTSPMVESSL